MLLPDKILNAMVVLEVICECGWRGKSSLNYNYFTLVGFAAEHANLLKHVVKGTIVIDPKFVPVTLSGEEIK